MSQTKRSSRPRGEAGRYLSDDQFYRFYLELVVNKESVLTSSVRAGINRNTGYKMAAQFDALLPGEKHPRILEIEKERQNTVADNITWLDPTQKGKFTSKLQKDLDNLVVGQTAAKEAIIENYELYTAGLVVPSRPVGSFLFLGPTGSGKTHLVESLAASLVGNRRAMVKIDCAEFQHSHEIAKLIGSPPGYLGHRETHPLLSQERLNMYLTEKKLNFVLFDEIEKASNALWNLLLGILDKASLTLGDNRIVDFSKSMIFMTSNLGAREMADLGAPKWFNLETTKVNYEKTKSVGIGAAKKKFTLEFYNRLDYVVVFDALTRENTEKILDLQLNEVETRIAAAIAHSFFLKLTGEAYDELLNRGFDAKYGARALNRTLAKEIEKPIAGLINSGQIVFKHGLLVHFENGKFLFGEPRGGSLAA